MAASSRPLANILTEPLLIGTVTLPNRLVSAPMERNYCNTEGHMTAQYEDYLLDRARAGVGLLFTEATFVRQDGKGRSHQLGAHNDSCVAPLAHLVDLLHAEGSLVGCELNHGGRTAQSSLTGLPSLAPSPVPCLIAGGEMPRELTTDEVYELVAAFADGAERCVRAGVDVLAIHAGHGYLVHQFMSPLYNLRTDEFADPAAFLTLVIEAVRARVGRTTLGIRISAVEGTTGGLDADQTFAIVQRLPLDLIDFIDVSAGSYEAGEWIVQSGEWEPGYLRHIAQRYRSLGKPMGLAGRINSPDAARMIIDGGFADFVSLGRSLHADPLFATAALHGGTYRPCIACNVCIDNLGTGQVGCSVNPAVGRNTVLLPLPTLPHGTTATVVGAGPAGLTAARELAIAGAAVTLIDRDNSNGGSLARAALMRSTPDFHLFLNWSDQELRRLHVTRVTADAHADDQRNTDGTVVAIGGIGAALTIPGMAADHVHDIRDWLNHQFQESNLPEAVTIWGANAVGMSVADTLASLGVHVLLLGAETEIAPESGRRAKILAVPRLRANPQVRIELGVSLNRIDQDAVQICRDGGAAEWINAPGPLLVSQGIQDADFGPVQAGATPVRVVRSHPEGASSTIRFAVSAGRDAAAELAGTIITTASASLVTQNGGVR
ncbi:oxidoreductase [Cryobacterium aureum]|uniref:oxidoreductase n=1 Tax=Cryobacterium aureum TaxID=995037 RepID=UPI000CF57560|nr:FAD-dependent oxidoreductase [Cryobacterium aureum]